MPFAAKPRWTDIFISAIFIIRAPHVQATESYDPSGDMMAAFGSQCSANGPLSNQALGQSNALGSIITSIQRDPKCGGVGDALRNMQLSFDATQEKDVTAVSREQIMNEIHSVETALHDELTKPTLPASSSTSTSESTLTSVDPITGETVTTTTSSSNGTSASSYQEGYRDPQYVTALQTQLISLKQKMLSSQYHPDTARKTMRLNAAKNFYKYSNDVFDQLSNSLECNTSNPNLAAQIGAQVLALSSSLVPGAAGSLMLATGSFTSNLLAFVRNRKINAQAQKLIAIKTSEAAGCALEAMSNTWCQARDAQTLLKYNAQNRASCSPSWEGVGLVGRDLPSYLQWVSRINSGAEANNSAMASLKKQADALELVLKNYATDMSALINETAVKVSEPGSNQEGLILNLLDRINDATVPVVQRQIYDSTTQGQLTIIGPLVLSFPVDQRCGPMVYFFSTEDPPPPPINRKCDRGANTNETCLVCINRVYPQYRTPTLPQIKKRLALLKTEGEDYVNREKRRVQESDPLLALNKVDEDPVNRRSARQYLEGVVSYTTYLLDESKAGGGIAKDRLGELIQDAKSKGTRALDIINNKGISPDEAEQNLTKILAPNQNIYQLPDQIQFIVKKDVDRRVAESGNENLAMIMQLSSSDSVSELLRGYFGAQETRTQASLAKSYTQHNMDAVSEIFGESFETRLKNLSEMTDDDSKELLGLTCVRLTLIPSLAKFSKATDLEDYCKNATYPFLYRGEPLNFAKLAKMPFDQRVCALYDFRRKSRIVEQSQSK